MPLKPAQITIALLLLATVFGCASRQALKSQDDLVLVTTTDFHASLDRAEGMASVIRALKKQYGDRMLYLDGGDLFQGSLEGNLSKGRSIVDFFNHIGLDAAAIGNHELDYGSNSPKRVSIRPGEDGMGNLKTRVRQAHFAWLSANLLNDSTLKPVFAPHAIFERAGKKVCVIGATTPSTAYITNPDFVKGTHFEPLRPVVEREALFLRTHEHCDFVVLTVHAGLLCDSNGSPGHCRGTGDRAEILPLLQQLPRGTLDAVVAGHTHLLGQDEFNGTPVIEAGAFAGAVGVLHLWKNHYQFDSFIETKVEHNGETADITALLKPYRDTATRIKERVVGHSQNVFKRDYPSENALVNLVADAVLEAGRASEHAQFSLVNAGGIRADLAMGTLRYGDVFKVLPFDNSLTVVEMTGAQLRRCLEIALSGGHGTSGISGLRIRRRNAAPGARGDWDRDLDGDGKKEDWERNLILEISDDKGQPINDAHKYKLATLDYLARGGDHQSLVFNSIAQAAKHFHDGTWARDVLVRYLKKHPNPAPESYYDPRRPRIELVE